MRVRNALVFFSVVLWAASAFAGGGLVDSSWQATESVQHARSLAIAIGAYHIDNGRYPAAKSMVELAAAIAPMYIRTVPMKDGWGTEFLYRVSDDGKSYVIASPGSDRQYDESVWQESVYSRSSKDDLVYASDGTKREWVIQDICH